MDSSTPQCTSRIIHYVQWEHRYRFVTIPQLIEHLPAQGTAPAHITPDQFTPGAVIDPLASQLVDRLA